MRFGEFDPFNHPGEAFAGAVVLRPPGNAAIEQKNQRFIEHCKEWRQVVTSGLGRTSLLEVGWQGEVANGVLVERGRSLLTRLVNAERALLAVLDDSNADESLAGQVINLGTAEIVNGPEGGGVMSYSEGVIKQNGQVALDLGGTYFRDERGVAILPATFTKAIIDGTRVF